jgi:peptidoglycan/xylan/chitin deacetylase (PgdA/CDA1 family)
MSWTSGPVTDAAAQEALDDVQTDVLTNLKTALTVTEPWPSAQRDSTFLTRFASGHGWISTAGGGGGSIDLNSTEQAAFGFQSVKVVSGTGSSYTEKTGMTVDLSASSLLVWVYVADTSVAFTVYAGDDSFTNYYLWSGGFSETGWQVAEFFKDDATPTGSPSAAAITHIRLRVEATSKTAYFGAVATRPYNLDYPNGLVTFTFDDGGVSNFTEGRAKLDQHGFPATAFIIADQIGADANYMTLANLKHLRDISGWEVGAHAYNLAIGHAGTGYIGLTAAQLDAEAYQLKEWLVSNGFKSDNWASPFGSSNDTVWAVMRRYFRTHRTVMTTIGSYPRRSAPPVLPHRLPSLCWDTASTSVANFQTEIDNAAATNTWLVLCFHTIVASGATGGAINRADFATIVDYVNTSGCAVKTMQEVYEDVRLP